MGRPWWYDSYWEKGKKPKKSPQLPRRSLIVWASVLLLSLLMTVSSGGFHSSIASWLLGFVYHLCRVLTFIIFVRALLSWFAISPYSLLVVLLNEVTEPILSPLRRIVPRLGMFDITPLVAIAILSIIPTIIYAILF